MFDRMVDQIISRPDLRMASQSQIGFPYLRIVAQDVRRAGYYALNATPVALATSIEA
jgi:hypothetical protein